MYVNFEELYTIFFRILDDIFIEFASKLDYIKIKAKTES